MIPKLLFGRTGHLSTRTLFGAAALGRVSQAEADRTLDVLLQYGVNHIDTAASYGEAELRIGPWLRQQRRAFFLATKTGERTYAAAREQLHRSLERLQTDHVDLIQLHFLVDEQEWQTAMGPGGALEALVEARQQGLARFIGVTGHELAAPAMHLRSLARFDFDTVLLPYNFLMAQDAQYAAGFAAVQAACQERNVAVQTIKSLLRRPWGDQPHTRTTWYEPLEDQADIDRAVWWLLGHAGIFLNTVGDCGLLPKVLSAAERFQGPPNDADMQAMVERLALQPLFV